MEALFRAIAVTERIRDALSDEVERARGERAFIRTMNADALMRRATLRAEFNAATAGLQRDLAQSFAEVGQTLGLSEITLDAICDKAPAEGRRLDAALAEVRALAAALAELDHLNRMLGHRVMAYVRAHLAVLAPRPAAYDRRGEAAAAQAKASTVVRVA